MIYFYRYKDSSYCTQLFFTCYKINKPDNSQLCFVQNAKNIKGFICV